MLAREQYRKEEVGKENQLQAVYIWNKKERRPGFKVKVVSLVISAFGGGINPIQDGGGRKKPPPTSFSPVTSTNVGLSPQNFLTNPLPRWCKTSRSYLVLVPNYWTWTKITSQKSGFSGEILVKLTLW